MHHKKTTRTHPGGVVLDRSRLLLKVNSACRRIVTDDVSGPALSSGQHIQIKNRKALDRKTAASFSKQDIPT